MRGGEGNNDIKAKSSRIKIIPLEIEKLIIFAALSVLKSKNTFTLI